MKIFVDIDETICVSPEDRDYSKAEPLQENIALINGLYDAGHEITYWTARGTVTGIDWSSVTLEQFKKWRVKYHDLMFQKPPYDIFICDKAHNTNDIKRVFEQVIGSSA